MLHAQLAAPLEDEPQLEAGVPDDGEGKLPRIRVVTRGVAVALSAAIGGLCYLVDSSSVVARPPAICEGFDGIIVSVVFTGDGRRVAACTIGGSLILWEPDSGQLQSRCVRPTGVRLDTEFSADGSLLGIVDSTAEVTLWNVASCRLRAALPRQNSPRVALAFSRDGRTLALAGSTHIRFWNTITVQPRSTPPLTRSDVRDLAIAPDGRTLAIATRDGTLRLCDATDGTQRILCRTDPTSSPKLTFADHGGVLAFCPNPEGRAELWNVARGRRLAVLESGSRITSLAFAPGSRMLATACRDGNVRIWDAASGRLKQALAVSEEAVVAVAFSADGRSLACGGFGSIRLFNLEEFSVKSHRAHP